jgi:hypothetical protein
VKTTVDNLSNEVRRVIIRRQQAFERLRKMKSTGGVWGIVRK